MAGAMAGSAVLNAPARSSVLHTVTLTINDSCNLSCPHCYLQYGAGAGELGWEDAERILASPARHFAIVGKEPLASRRSAALTARFVDAVARSGRTVSIITNGLNLRLLDDATIAQLSWVDISIDGSRESYQSYRGGSFQRLAEGIADARRRGLRDLRILHTVSAGNLADTGAALATALDFSPTAIVVSPFQATRANGVQRVSMVAPDALLDAMESSGAAANSAVWLALDSGYTGGAVLDRARVARALALFGERFIYVTSDPIDRGLIRVTFDGLVLSPFESVHTSDYARVGRPLGQRPLEDWHRMLLMQRAGSA
jgi:hypothetical protein